jgi:hypothetical protein
MTTVIRILKIYEDIIIIKISECSEMEQQDQQLKLVRSEELLSRFRSKADLYRYLTE